ncbi:hypothetical protein BHE74_00050426, partial [Ensete ventricosum]
AVRTLVDSKLGCDHYRGSTSLKLYRGSLIQITAQRLQKNTLQLMIKSEGL